MRWNSKEVALRLSSWSGITLLPALSVSGSLHFLLLAPEQDFPTCQGALHCLLKESGARDTSTWSEETWDCLKRPLGGDQNSGGSRMSQQRQKVRRTMRERARAAETGIKNNKIHLGGF